MFPHSGVKMQIDDHAVTTGGINLRGQLMPVYGLPGKMVSCTCHNHIFILVYCTALHQMACGTIRQMGCKGSATAVETFVMPLETLQSFNIEEDLPTQDLRDYAQR